MFQLQFKSQENNIMIIFCQPLYLLTAITKISPLFYFYFYLAFTSKPKRIAIYIHLPILL